MSKMTSKSCRSVWPIGGLALLAILACVAFLSWPIDRVEAANPSVGSAPVMTVNPGLQIRGLRQVEGPSEVGNAIPHEFMLAIRRNTRSGNTLENELQTIDASSLVITAAPTLSVSDFSSSCSAALSSTILECDLTPTGATWTTAGNIALKIRLATAEGHVAENIVIFPINPTP